MRDACSDLQGHLHKSNMYASSIGLQELTSTSPTSESIPEASSTIPAHAPSIFTAAEFNYTWVRVSPWQANSLFESNHEGYLSAGRWHWEASQ